MTFEIVAASSANSAPTPKALSAWAVSGQMTRIPVPLTGIDPDGDSVALVGIDQPPSKGSVVLGTEWLEYTPSDDAVGTDTFSYIVEDRLGLRDALACVSVLRLRARRTIIRRLCRIR